VDPWPWSSPGARLPSAISSLWLSDLPPSAIRGAIVAQLAALAMLWDAVRIDLARKLVVVDEAWK